MKDFKIIECSNKIQVILLKNKRAIRKENYIFSSNQRDDYRKLLLKELKETIIESINKQ